MHGYRKRSLSSNSDEDFHSTPVDQSGKEYLYACEIISCEFCDEAFLNRYNYLVHNAKHIIIPLLRTTYFKCKECNLQCRTNRKFQKHMKKRHPDITNSHHNNNTNYSIPSAEFQIVNNNIQGNDNTDCKNDVKTTKNGNGNQILSTFEREINLSTSQNNMLPHYLPENNKSSNDIMIIEIESDDDEVKVKEELINNNDNAETMRNRLIFEEEEEDIIKSNGLISDLMADIKVSVPVEQWMSSISDKKKNEDTAIGPESIETRLEKKWRKEIIRIGPKSTETQLEKKWREKTISYQELIKMENVTCQYCNETFLNRLSLIEHQSCHIASKRRYPLLCLCCDWYVASDPPTLYKHYKRSHPDIEVKSMSNVIRKTCPLCKLKYVSKQKHFRNYHNTEIEIINDQEENKDILKPIFVKKVIKICDLCSSFLKNVSNNVYYKNLGEESISGVRQTCARCLKQYFSINLVEITSRHKFGGPRKPKPVSNRDRLKNFQNRLKLMKK